MGDAAVRMKVMPESAELDLNKLAEDIKKAIPSFARLHAIEEMPIAGIDDMVNLSRVAARLPRVLVALGRSRGGLDRARAPLCEHVVEPGKDRAADCAIDQPVERAHDNGPKPGTRLLAGIEGRGQFEERTTVAWPNQICAAPRATRGPVSDALTGLPTRQFFEERLAAAAKRCDAKRGNLAVLFFDLDGFKPVNDTFGHACGDRVLEQVGVRLRSITRGADVAARVGGDEFLLLMPAVSSQVAVAKLAKSLIEILSRPYKVEDREVNISCSVGIALYPDGCRAYKLIPRADAAMYAAKRAGGTRHAFFAPEMDHDAKQNFEMVRDLKRAIAKSELELYLQPKIDARSGKVTAAEALIRWNYIPRGIYSFTENNVPITWSCPTILFLDQPCS